MTEPGSTIKSDYQIILDTIEPNSSVLDLGCGNGELLELLVNKKKVKAQGIEIDEKAIYMCVAKGLSVFQGDLDTGLVDYADKSFDYVIINETLQQVIKPDVVLIDALRVGNKVIVGFPNFTNLRARLQIFFQGRTPMTPSLPYEWHNTPNLHFLSIKDFQEYCKNRGIIVEQTYFLSVNKQVNLLPNLLALTAIFIISK